MTLFEKGYKILRMRSHLYQISSNIYWPVLILTSTIKSSELILLNLNNQVNRRKAKTKYSVFLLKEYSLSLTNSKRIYRQNEV
jgi:hypothetical protein